MYAVQAEGESMSPKINHGSIVYCNVNRRIENGSIVHYSLDGESGIKRYKINERGDIISLIPINSDYDIITIHADDRMELKMARVVGVVDTDF
jgi:SOS-response transcriptional repressor LexA